MDPPPPEDANSRAAAGSAAGQRGFHSCSVGDPSLSVAFAVQVIARGAGCELDLDDLASALGLPFTTCAVPGEEDLSCWSLCGRNAFLVETGRLLGISFRAVHPPAAARGLDKAPEFEQHFQASYRPLILRALEHDQPILAWQGWPGDRTGLWGVISDTCGAGIGLCGFTMTPTGGSPEGTPLALQSPPVQLYVVETTAPVKLGSVELVGVAVDHARRALGSELKESFGVVTGPAAYDAWIARLICGGGGSAAATELAKGHSRMATATVAGQESAIRFFRRHVDGVASEMRSLIEALIESCQGSVTALSESANLTAVAELLQTTAGRRKLAEQVAAARAAATKALIALQSRTRPAGRR